MSAQPTESWQSLFSDDAQESGNARIRMRVLRRHGEPFLMVPLDARSAARSLRLYPAQSRVARLAVSLMELSFKIGIPAAREKVSILCSTHNLFVQFLMELMSVQGIPPFALLAGNARAPGRRFVLLLFDQQNRPASVVKVGKGAAAVRLIEQEDFFLRSVPQGTRGVPSLKSAFGSGNVRAIALPYLEGKPPALDDLGSMGSLLSSWIDEKRLVRLNVLHVWRKLESQQNLKGVNLGKLGCASLHPVIYHGDFAPWNIRVNKGNWQVLDWERGEPAGVPSWDWFHFYIQSDVLVKKLPILNLIDNVEQMLGSPAFLNYAARAGITGLEKDLLLAYLNYSIQVLQQTEELPRVQGLLEALISKWSMPA